MRGRDPTRSARRDRDRGPIALVGINVQLGASPSDVFWLVMNRGRTLAVVGVVLGLAAAYVTERLAASRLAEVSAADPILTAAAAILLLGITLLAIVVPAARASRVDPVRVLRPD